MLGSPGAAARAAGWEPSRLRPRSRPRGHLRSQDPGLGSGLGEPGREQGPSPLGPDHPHPTLLCTRVSGCQCCWASSVGSRGGHPRAPPPSRTAAGAPQSSCLVKQLPPVDEPMFPPQLANTQQPGGGSPTDPPILPLVGLSQLGPPLSSAFQSWFLLAPPRPQLLPSVPEWPFQSTALIPLPFC